MKYKLIFMILIWFSISQLVFGQQIVDGYLKEVIVSLPWGNEPGEIGDFKIITQDMVGSPFTIAVDNINNNIYFLDGSNSRIQVFDQYGEIIRVFKIKNQYSYNDAFIEINENSQIYVHLRDEKLFNVYSLSGDILKTIQYSENIAPRFMVTDNVIISGASRLSIDDATPQMGIGSGGEDIYTARIQTDPEMFIENNNIGKYTNRQYIRTNINYTVKLPNNSTQMLDFEKIAPGRLPVYLGETTQKEVIFEGVIPNGLNSISVLKFDENFKLVSTINDPDYKKRTIYSSRFPMKMADNGVIYTLFIDSDGAKIYKWIMK